MTKTVRYCILCGREIGDRYNCPNPDCGNLPNFYRDVPGPQSASEKSVRPSRPQLANGGSRNKTLPEQVETPPRQTIPMGTAPPIVLRRTVPPHQEYPLQPGETLVGAQPPAKILLDLPEVSSRHASIQATRDPSGQWNLSIVDHDSTNGTFVNDKRVDRSDLKGGDRVRFASVELDVRFIDREKRRHTIQM